MKRCQTLKFTPNIIGGLSVSLLWSVSFSNVLTEAVGLLIMYNSIACVKDFSNFPER